MSGRLEVLEGVSKMDHFELVEKLREKAKVSYEDAKAALEQNEWDLLDALVYLEKQGKIDQEEAASFTTKQEPRPQAAPQPADEGVFKRIIDALASIINRMNKISLEARRRGKTVLTLPLTALALLLIFLFWVTIPLMVLGLFFGYTYRFQGSDAVGVVNKAMDKAAGVAENIRTGVHQGDHSDN